MQISRFAAFCGHEYRRWIGNRYKATYNGFYTPLQLVSALVKSRPRDELEKVNSLGGLIYGGTQTLCLSIGFRPLPAILGPTRASRASTIAHPERPGLSSIRGNLPR